MVEQEQGVHRHRPERVVNDFTIASMPPRYRCRRRQATATVTLTKTAGVAENVDADGDRRADGPDGRVRAGVGDVGAAARR